MLKTVEELKTLIENEPKYEGCGIDLPSGKCIGTTSGGWQPLLYQSPEDNNPTNLTWTEALALFNKEVRTVHYNKPSTTRILREGLILKANNFDTVKGHYTIRIILYNGKLYFHKMLNGSVVEIVNLLTLRLENNTEKEN